VAAAGAGTRAADGGERLCNASRCADQDGTRRNIAFDGAGHIWIVTDGAPSAAGVADGVYGADTAGFGRALTCCFYQAPTGAEVCGPIVTPDDRTMFLAIQHPGEDRGSTFEKPSTC